MNRKLNRIKITTVNNTAGIPGSTGSKINPGLSSNVGLLNSSMMATHKPSSVRMKAAILAQDHRPHGAKAGGNHSTYTATSKG